MVDTVLLRGGTHSLQVVGELYKLLRVAKGIRQWSGSKGRTNKFPKLDRSFNLQHPLQEIYSMVFPNLFSHGFSGSKNVWRIIAHHSEGSVYQFVSDGIQY